MQQRIDEVTNLCTEKPINFDIIILFSFRSQDGPFFCGNSEQESI